MDAKSFGAFVARRRGEKGMTQAELAERLNVTDKAVSRWERGVGLPDINTLEPLASSLDLSIQEIMHSKRNTYDGEPDDYFIYALSSYFNGLEVYIKEARVEKQPAFIREHIECSGKIYAAEEPMNGKLLVVPSMEPDVVSVYVNLDDVFIKIEANTGTKKPKFKGCMPKSFCDHAKNGGALYMHKAPEYGKMFVSTSMEPGGESIKCDYWVLKEKRDIDYAGMGDIMKKSVNIIRQKNIDDNVKTMNCYLMRTYLDRLLEVKELDELTAVYRDEAEDLIIGYNPTAVLKFVNSLCDVYPKNTKIYNRCKEHRKHIYAEIAGIMDSCLDVMVLSCEIYEKKGELSQEDIGELEDANELLSHYLNMCLKFDDLRALTNIYRTKREDNEVGYEPEAIVDFVEKLKTEYPLPE